MATEIVSIHGLKGVMDTLRSLPPALVSKNGGPVLRALRKAGKVIQKQAQENVQRIIDAPNKGGLPTDSTGLLKKSIIVKRGRFRAGGERVYISIRGKQKYGDKMYTPKSRSQGSSRRRAPKARPLFANDIGFMLEHGTETRPPMPWIRPAYEMKKNEAVAVFTDDITRNLARIVKKLARQNGVKS